MCWTDEEVTQMLKEFNDYPIAEEFKKQFIDDAGCNVAGGLFDFGPEDFKCREKRIQVFFMTLGLEAGHYGNKVYGQ